MFSLNLSGNQLGGLAANCFRLFKTTGHPARTLQIIFMLTPLRYKSQWIDSSTAILALIFRFSLAYIRACIKIIGPFGLELLQLCL